MLHYIIQTVIFQLLFLLVYDFFLKKETFFNWNRFYLLVSAFLSIVLPFIKVNSFEAVFPKEYIYVLPELIIGNPINNNFITNDTIINSVSATTFSFSWSYIVYLGCAIALMLLVMKVLKLVILAYKNPIKKFGKVFLVELANSKHAFSFFNYIFLGTDINTQDRQTILAHELEHVKEKHSLDLLFFEVLKVLFWFNPLLYTYQKRIANLHEFIADSKAVKTGNKVEYYENLLSQVFDTKKEAFINPFFKHSLIKKRIIMLSKSESKQIYLAKYLLIFPLVIGMLFYTSSNAQDETLKKEKAKQGIVNQETSGLSEEALVNKYADEIRALKKEKEFYTEDNDGYKKYIPTDNNNYLKTLDEYARFKAYTIVLYEGMISKGDESNALSYFNKANYKNYQDYLVRKNTQESIKYWENWPPTNQLRKHVKDLDNITNAEQQQIDNQIAQIKNDKLLHTQIISDGLRHEERNFSLKKIDEVKEFKVISNVNIDQVPIFPNCEALVLNNEQRKCFNDKINEVVAKNFNTDLGKSLKLKGKVKIYTRFTINDEGNIVNVESRASHPALVKEAIRVVNLIPQVKPGQQDGSNVNVTFDLPITFNIK